MHKKYDITIYRVTHDMSLLKRYPCKDDGIRVIYTTEHSPWGKYLNEFCVWLDESINPTTEFVGLEHYRRTFKPLTSDNCHIILNKINEGECITYEVRYIGKIQPYLDAIKLQDIKKQLEDYFRQQGLLKELNLLSQHLTIWRSMFIMHRSDFIKLRKFLLDVICYLFEANNIKEPSDIDKLVKDYELYKDGGYTFQKHRTFAYVLESMTDIWIRANMKTYFPISHYV